ncbi:hypothetical protein D3C78_1264430 [compost metagenome]
MHICISTTGRLSAPPAPRTLTLRSTLRSNGALTSRPLWLSLTSTVKRTHFSPFFWKCSRSLASIDEVSAPVSILIFTEMFSGWISPSSTQPNTWRGASVLLAAKAVGVIRAPSRAAASQLRVVCCKAVSSSQYGCVDYARMRVKASSKAGRTARFAPAGRHPLDCDWPDYRSILDATLPPGAGQ